MELNSQEDRERFLQHPYDFLESLANCIDDQKESLSSTILGAIDYCMHCFTSHDFSLNGDAKEHIEEVLQNVIYPLKAIEDTGLALNTHTSFT